MPRITYLNLKKADLLTIAREKATAFNSPRLDKMLFMSWVQPFRIIIAVNTEEKTGREPEFLLF